MNQQTLTIIKPNAMKKNVVGDIIHRFEEGGLRLAAAEMRLLTKDDAQMFYLEHKGKAFYEELVAFMTSGPVLLMVYEGPNAIEKARTIMGHTDPAKAEKGTIRAIYGDSLGQNAVHGSDSPKSAEREVQFFFSKTY